MDDDDEAALLAELRAISARSATSRFGPESVGDSRDQDRPIIDSKDLATPEVPVGIMEGSPGVTTASEKSRRTPPWKRTPKEPAVVVAVPAPPSSPIPDSTHSRSSPTGSAASSSTGSSRYTPWKEVIAHSKEARTSPPTAPTGAATESTVSSPSVPKRRDRGSGSGLSTWKRLTTRRRSSSSQSHSNKNHNDDRTSQNDSTMQPSPVPGERGGAAEDEELLKELRAISEKSDGARRFADSGSHDNGKVGQQDEQEPPTSPTSPTPKRDNVRSRRGFVPPWKRSPRKKLESQSPEKECGVTALETNDSLSSRSGHGPSEAGPYGVPTDALPSTFTGERGGKAEDEDLLAELRAISAKSSGADRFAGNNDSNPPENAITPASTALLPAAAVSIDAQAPSPPKAKATNRERSGGVPPWKRANRKKMEKSAPDESAMVVAPKALNVAEVVAPEVTTGQGGFKSDLPSTFTGERGGTAEDAELLALLRGVSDKGGDRFSEDGPRTFQAASTQSEVAATPSLPTSKDESPESTALASNRNRAVPPWKGGKSATVLPVASTTEDSVLPEAVPLHFGIQQDDQFTFKGERGGKAEDAELLALLRGVSSKSSGADRFGETSEQSPVPIVAKSRQLNPTTTKESSSVSGRPPVPIDSLPPETSATEDIELSREELPSSIRDKNWKVRCQAYSLLGILVTELSQGKPPSGAIDSDDVLPGLDNLVVEMVQDSNAGALDKGIEFSLVYADYCRGASASEQAGKIVSGMVKKNAFSSRPTTLKLATELTLKLMEVGTEGASSIHAVTEVLLREGLASRKPKISQASASLIFDSACAFGAANLPLASISSLAPKMLSHTNAKVREYGMKIIAEICRALGGKAPLQTVLDGMKKTQLAELDGLLLSQPAPTTPRRKIRNQAALSTGAPRDALASLEDGAKELAAQRFAARPAINIMEALRKTDYSSRLSHVKWSEKVAALEIVLVCGGEKPYKLVEPSASANYSPLIGDMRKLLSHTHFAVCSKAMQVLSLLAEGVGERLYASLRPLFSLLLAMSKDKKLTRQVSASLDSFFGNVLTFEHLLDSDDALPECISESKQKNALVRVTGLAFLTRCIVRRKEAGPRGSLSPRMAGSVASFCASKLDDSDASVRKATMGVFEALQGLDDPECLKSVSNVVESLKASHSRAYKTLSQGTHKGNSSAASKGCKAATAVKGLIPGPSTCAGNHNSLQNNNPPQSKPSSRLTADVGLVGEFYAPILNDAVEYVASMHIPQWEAEEDEAGVLAGLQSSQWLLRQNAIKALTAYIESGSIPTDPVTIETSTSSMLVVVREHTRSFNETNVNIMKAILELFVAVFEFHADAEHVIVEWAARDATSIAAQKISDRKLGTLCQSVLSSACLVSSPYNVLSSAIESLKGVKSPVAHEEFLKWTKLFCCEFGAPSIGNGITDLIPWILEELNATNPKVKREALSLAGLIHTQLGPSFGALAISMTKKSDVRTQLDKCFAEFVYDTSFEEKQWQKSSFASILSCPDAIVDKKSLVLNVPKTDLFTVLPDDLLSKLGCADGKAAWKKRKEAMDEIDLATRSCVGHFDTSSPKLNEYVELFRKLRDRLSDTQINLKPVAAKLVAVLLSKVDKSSQARLGKIVFATLIHASMNDIKKAMRHTSLEALRSGITISSFEKTGLNDEALEGLVSALVNEITEKSVRAGGLPDLLHFLVSVAEKLPNLDKIASSRGQPLGEKYAAVLVECLTSSKSETRAAASLLLEESINNEVIGMDSIRKATELLKPARQRSIIPVISKFGKNLGRAEKENSLDEEGAHRVRAKSTAERPHPQKTAQGKTRQSRNLPNMDSDIIESSENGTSGLHPTTHPLVIGTGKKGRLTSKSIVWPEYPEEAQGSAIFSNLRKAWAAYLPADSVAGLFPPSGIRKQDDSQAGCEILARAIALDSSERGDSVEDQLDFVFRWIAFVLCSKEATVGLQTLLSLVCDIISFLVDRKHELSDSESLLLFPFLIEKASIAKGRFRDAFLEIVAMLRSEAIMPSKRLGSVICVAIIERSVHAKARLLAYQIGSVCVDQVGLAGVGKKGVLATAKALSEETMAENRNAALDLMNAILSRMNGDTNRLVRICGPNLSDKARQHIEERWLKRETSQGPSNTPDRRTRLPLPSSSSHHTSKNQSNVGFYDELPALSLRNTSYQDSFKANLRSVDADISTEDPFAFSLASRKSPLPLGTSTETTRAVEKPKTNETDTDRVLRAETDSVGAAATLRARLLKIREKGRLPDDGIALNSLEQDIMNDGDASLALEYSNGMLAVKNLFQQNVPVHEDNESLFLCVESLKKFHAALSKQQNSIAGLSPQQLVMLRQFIAKNVNETIEQLTRLIGFAFRCGDPGINSGLSIPLLSVCLATLMAIFRDSALSFSVSQDDLTLLVRETGKALLDSRLAATSDLDSATSSQMVRAINKLAVQAATGAARHTALQSLMTLQKQLSSEGDNAFTGRLSRVVSKLFGRVLKAEVAERAPFSRDRLDMESLICTIDDLLVGNNELEGENSSDQAPKACTEMIEALVVAILESNGGSSLLQELMIELDIYDESSALGTLIAKYDVGRSPDVLTHINNQVVTRSIDFPMDGPVEETESNDVTALVSALGSAAHGPERDVALDALRQYKASQGDGDLKAHLEQVSPAFRAYIEEQLEGHDSSPQKHTSALGAGSMSERLRNLRSRLQATELAVQTVFDEAGSETDASILLPVASPIASPRSSRLAKPSPSKLAKPSAPQVDGGMSSAQTLRERLAATQISRRRGPADDLKGANSGEDASAMATSRAAALRARLEAVKNKQQSK